MITVWLVLFFFENVCVCECVSSWKNMILATAAAEDATKTASGNFFKYLYVCLCAWLYIFNMHCLTYE